MNVGVASRYRQIKMIDYAIEVILSEEKKIANF
jgi:hypothetical protein